MSADARAKADLRRSLRARLMAVSPSECAEWSRLVRAHLLADDSWLAPGSVVSLFGGLPGEADLLPLLEFVHARGARAVFFSVHDKDLAPFEVRSIKDLVRGVLGVWEPAADPSRRVSPGDLTVVFTPGLAFGRADGARLGRGAGYYDRLFANGGARARRIGVGFDCQFVDHVPVESHDARLDAVVTQSGWHCF